MSRGPGLCLRHAVAAAWGLWIALGASTVHALSPLTPQLTTASRLDLEARLAAAGMPEVGHNSVVIALTAVLGFEPHAQTYRYDEPYPHLPQVETEATPAAVAGCADVRLHARWGSVPSSIRLKGSYCLVGPAQWEARSLAAD